MRWSDYRTANDLTQAFEALGSGGHCRVIAGGTDVVVQLDKQPEQAESVTLVDVAGIPELAGIVLQGDRLVIGAAVTMADVAGSDLVWKHAAALAEGAAAAASPLIRNVATVGGNVVNASPAADTVPGLIVAGAVAELATMGGWRQVPVEDIQVGPGACSLAKGELLVRVSLPAAAEGEGQAFLKLGRRKALSISMVNVAARVSVDGEVVREAAVVLGAVAPRFVVMRRELTELLSGRAWDEEARREVAALVEATVNPISDLRAGAEYRKKMAGVFAVRALTGAYQRACGREKASPDAAK